MSQCFQLSRHVARNLQCSALCLGVEGEPPAQRDFAIFFYKNNNFKLILVKINAFERWHSLEISTPKIQLNLIHKMAFVCGG